MEDLITSLELAIIRQHQGDGDIPLNLDSAVTRQARGEFDL